MSLTIEEETAKLLLKNKAVALNPKKPFKYVSGIRSPIYTDNRLLIGIPQARREIVNCLLFLMKEHNIQADVVAGTATAGIPWATLLAEKLNLPAIYVRSEKKEHGKGKQIEGYIKKGSSVLVVEDLISTGSSSITTVKILREAGHKVENCIAIFDYGLKKSKDNFSGAQVMHYSLTNLNRLVEIAIKQKYVKESDRKTILDWQKDPENWGDKMGFA
ncbi:MAG: orotate phosphoribosyltransferase [Nanoarchaeota archaeon]|nr:orotate phosphoribosyltransferase [Nanoarchaeota archaeon]